MAGHNWVHHRANPRNFSKVFLEQWEEDNNFSIRLSSLSRLREGKMMKPALIWNSHPIQMMVGPISHFFHDIGNLRTIHNMAMTEALKPRILVSWNINMSSTYKNEAWGK
jgi:hypothetical protein